MKILITGANGMLAKAVIKKFEKENELILTDVDTLDITSLQEVVNLVCETNPDCIINCAAYTEVDHAEDKNELEKVEKINATGPLNLATICKVKNMILVHVSTDYVFGGDLSLDKEYSEEDEKNPVTVYGITKLHGEENIKKVLDKYYIFRTAWLYGDGKNFVRTMLNLGEKYDKIDVVSDQYGSPTYTEDLANYIYEAVTKQIPYGVYNATNEGNISWYEFTKEIFRQANIDCKVNPVTTEEYIKMKKIVQAQRPYNSQLSKEKLKSAGIEVPQWEESLNKYLKLERKM